MQLSGRAGTPPWMTFWAVMLWPVPPDYPKKFCNAVELVWGPVQSELRLQGFVKLQQRLPAFCSELMFARKHLNKWNT